jgi:hypothetical protein
MAPTLTLQLITHTKDGVKLAEVWTVIDADGYHRYTCPKCNRELNLQKTCLVYSALMHYNLNKCISGAASKVQRAQQAAVIQAALHESYALSSRAAHLTNQDISSQISSPSTFTSNHIQSVTSHSTLVIPLVYSSGASHSIASWGPLSKFTADTKNLNSNPSPLPITPITSVSSYPSTPLLLQDGTSFSLHSNQDAPLSHSTLSTVSRGLHLCHDTETVRNQCLGFRHVFPNSIWSGYAFAAHSKAQYHWDPVAFHPETSEIALQAVKCQVSPGPMCINCDTVQQSSQFQNFIAHAALLTEDHAHVPYNYLTFEQLLALTACLAQKVQALQNKVWIMHTKCA